MNGGYTMIDCAGVELTSETAQTISGLYKRCEEAMVVNKPVFAFNITFEENAVSPVQTFLTKRPNGAYIATAATLQIIVAPNDSVTINNLAPSI